MMPEPMIAKDDAIEQRYVNYLCRVYWPSCREATLKHQYFQLLTDLSTVIPYYRYSAETGDCKVDDLWEAMKADAYEEWVLENERRWYEEGEQP